MSSEDVQQNKAQDLVHKGHLIEKDMTPYLR